MLDGTQYKQFILKRFIEGAERYLATLSTEVSIEDWLTVLEQHKAKTEIPQEQDTKPRAKQNFRSKLACMLHSLAVRLEPSSKACKDSSCDPPRENIKGVRRLNAPHKSVARKLEKSL